MLFSLSLTYLARIKFYIRINSSYIKVSYRYSTLIKHVHVLAELDVTQKYMYGTSILLKCTVLQHSADQQHIGTPQRHQRPRHTRLCQLLKISPKHQTMSHKSLWQHCFTDQWSDTITGYLISSKKFYTKINCFSKMPWFTAEYWYSAPVYYGAEVFSSICSY